MDAPFAKSRFALPSQGTSSFAETRPSTKHEKSTVTESGDSPLRPIRSAAIIGAGTMGGGISMSFANAGIPVTVIDVDAASLDRGLSRIRGNYASTVSKGRFTQEKMDERMALKAWLFGLTSG